MHDSRTVSKIWTFRATFLLVAAAGAACAGDPAPPALLVGDVGYSEGDLGALGPNQRERLAVLTAFGLAVARGELDELARPFIEQERDGLLLQKLAAEISAREAGMDEAALRAAYAADPEYELVVRHIVFISERWRPDAHRQEARDRAAAALNRARAGQNFAALAAELSEEPGASERGGLLRPGREGSWVPEFWEAARSLRPGEVSGVVETEYGYHVIKLEERRVVPFDEVRTRVLGRLVDLAAAAGRAREWAETQAEALRMDRAAVAEWRVGALPDSTVLARWPGGEYRAAEFETYVTTLNEDSRARLSNATTRAYAGVVEGAARNALLLDRAEELGIRLSPAESAATARRWRERAERWAAALGFGQGLARPQVKAAAMNALSEDRQSVRIARTEVLALTAALRLLYPISSSVGTTRSAMADGSNRAGEPR